VANPFVHIELNINNLPVAKDVKNMGDLAH